MNTAKKLLIFLGLLCKPLSSMEAPSATQCQPDETFLSSTFVKDIEKALVDNTPDIFDKAPYGSKNTDGQLAKFLIETLHKHEQSLFGGQIFLGKNIKQNAYSYQNYIGLAIKIATQIADKYLDKNQLISIVSFAAGEFPFEYLLILALRYLKYQKIAIHAVDTRYNESTLVDLFNEKLKEIGIAASIFQEGKPYKESTGTLSIYTWQSLDDLRSWLKEQNLSQQTIHAYNSIFPTPGKDAYFHDPSDPRMAQNTEKLFTMLEKGRPFSHSLNILSLNNVDIFIPFDITKLFLCVDHKRMSSQALNELFSQLTPLSYASIAKIVKETLTTGPTIDRFVSTGTDALLASIDFIQSTLAPNQKSIAYLLTHVMGTNVELYNLSDCLNAQWYTLVNCEFSEPLNMTEEEEEKYLEETGNFPRPEKYKGMIYMYDSSLKKFIKKI